MFKHYYDIINALSIKCPLKQKKGRITHPKARIDSKDKLFYMNGSTFASLLQVCDKENASEYDIDISWWYGTDS